MEKEADVVFTGRTAGIAIEMLAVSIWVGSLVCLGLVSATARRVLDAPSRVALFRRIGRLHGAVGTVCLVTAIAIGSMLSGPPSEWTGAIIAVLALSVGLLLVTVAGMVQARQMTVLRQRLVETRQDPDVTRMVTRGARRAAAVRGMIAFLTLAALVISASELSRLHRR